MNTMAERINATGSRLNGVTVTSRTAHYEASGRTVAQFGKVKTDFADAAAGLTPDFDMPRTRSQYADEQRAFLSTVPSGFYVDTEMPDND